ncbi:MAG: uroporphyrinogen decarboxylase family protein [Phycisphaeraceae bacterium]
MALLAGQCVDRPPLWEVWFAMPDFCRRRYGGDMTAMAADLGHAALCIGGLDIGSWWQAEVEPNDAGVWYGGGALRDADQLRQRPEPDYDAQVQPLLDAQRRCHDAGLATWLIIGWCFDRIAGSMGLEEFAVACYDRPEFIHQAMQWCEARNLQGVRRIVSKVRPDFVLYNGDCAYKTGTMIDPRMIRDFCFEPTRRTVQAVRDLGIPFTFHSDGKLDEVIPMLLNLGICAVHGCEKQAKDLGHLVQTFGDRIALCGNMDVVFLKHASPEEIRRETREMLRLGGVRGRFIAACNTSPQDYIPDENYLAFCRAVQAP